uniref:Branched-chain-amino-acid aminotransferase n=1 Tax=Gadus morhua TaxID=8049 RepID=A0A8C5CQ66_GADMO
MAALRTVLHRPFAQTLSLCLRPARFASSFKASDLVIERNTAPSPKPDPSTLVFGKQFSDHMLTIDWSDKDGWEAPQIKPFQNLSLHPASSALHYSIELFEGMKAFRGVDDRIRLFRPMHNMERMHRSAERSCLPLFDKAELLECIRKLVEVDQEWVPYSLDASLYIRPTFIGVEPSLGVSRAGKAMLFVIVGPVGPYFATGSFNPVSLLADPSFVRAWRGGVGAYKMGGNYGPTIAVQNVALQKGCQQVLWLYGEQEEITEVGTMNLFIYWTAENGEKELITPPLDGIILPGVTRQSLLDLSRAWVSTSSSTSSCIITGPGSVPPPVPPLVSSLARGQYLLQNLLLYHHWPWVSTSSRTSSCIITGPGSVPPPVPPLVSSLALGQYLLRYLLLYHHWPWVSTSSGTSSCIITGPGSVPPPLPPLVSSLALGQCLLLYLLLYHHWPWVSTSSGTSSCIITGPGSVPPPVPPLVSSLARGQYLLQYLLLYHHWPWVSTSSGTSSCIITGPGSVPPPVPPLVSSLALGQYLLQYLLLYHHWPGVSTSSSTSSCIITGPGSVPPLGILRGCPAPPPTLPWFLPLPKRNRNSG